MDSETSTTPAGPMEVENDQDISHWGDLIPISDSEADPNEETSSEDEIHEVLITTEAPADNCDSVISEAEDGYTGHHEPAAPVDIVKKF
jgi:hypothetical protein